MIFLNNSFSKVNVAAFANLICVFVAGLFVWQFVIKTIWPQGAQQNIPACVFFKSKIFVNFFLSKLSQIYPTPRIPLSAPFSNLKFKSLERMFFSSHKKFWILITPQNLHSIYIWLVPKLSWKIPWADVYFHLKSFAFLLQLKIWNPSSRNEISVTSKVMHRRYMHQWYSILDISILDISIVFTIFTDWFSIVLLHIYMYTIPCGMLYH